MIKSLYLGIVFLCIFTMTAKADISCPDNLWKCLIVEASQEGYFGMKAVALVYRNRLEKGMQLGCSGLQRKNLDRLVARHGLKYEKLAKSIVNEVFVIGCKDITYGATHYENVKKFGTPKWAKNMIITTVIGNHTFYKER